MARSRTNGIPRSCQTPTDPPDPSLPSLYRRSRTPLALLPALLQSSPPPPPPPPPSPPPSLLLRSLRAPFLAASTLPSSVVREPRDPPRVIPDCRSSFVLSSLCARMRSRIPRLPLVFPPSGLSYHTRAFSFSSSLFSPPAFPSFAHILPLPLPPPPITVHQHILVDPAGSRRCRTRGAMERDRERDRLAAESQAWVGDRGLPEQARGASTAVARLENAVTRARVNCSATVTRVVDR